MMALQGKNKSISMKYLLEVFLIFGVIAKQISCVTGQNNTFTGKFSIVKAGVNGASYESLVLGNYSSGDTVNITSFSNEKLSVAFDFVGSFTKVVLTYKSATDSFDTTERSPRYALKGNLGNNFNVVTDLNKPGTKQVVAVGYNGTTIIANVTLSFTIVQAPAPPTILKWVLVNAKNDTDVSQIVMDQVFNLTSIGTNELSVRLDGAPTDARRVVFTWLEDNRTKSHTENNSPYYMNANNKNNAFAVNYLKTIGIKSVNATIKAGNGTQIGASTIQFKLV